jgi:cysteine desulfurase/selenocysteine lyase
MNKVTDLFDVEIVRRDFPVLQQQIKGKPLIYLDNAATTQKPRQVLAALQRYYCEDNANIHRGVHALSVRATHAYEQVRELVRQFINAGQAHEIIFVRGATEAINLVAQSYGRSQLQAGDEIIISVLEHHSNIVPWQILCEQVGAVLRVIPINDAGELDLQGYVNLLNSRTKFVSLGHVSNAIGTINPLQRLIELAHQQQIPVLIDGAQGVPHMSVDVQALDCDFYVFSGHKLYGPTGIGVLYGKSQWLEMMPPYQGGGNMIKEVTFEKTSYNKLPYKFEAGTPNIAGVVGLGAAITYLNQWGIDRITQHEQSLLTYATERLSAISGLRIIGTAQQKAAVLSFVLQDIHPHDIGTVLDHEGIAIRVGHHCAMPLMARFNVSATARASFGLYNTPAEIEALADAIGKVQRLFA